MTCSIDAILEQKNPGDYFGVACSQAIYNRAIVKIVKIQSYRSPLIFTVTLLQTLHFGLRMIHSFLCAFQPMSGQTPH